MRHTHYLVFPAQLPYTSVSILLSLRLKYLMEVEEQKARRGLIHQAVGKV